MCWAKLIAGAGLLLATLCAALPGLHAQTRQVFAHYMLANRDYAPDDPSGERDIAAYQREIRQAQSLGIDGFALNAGGWFQEPRYIRRASEMFEAARRLHSGFRLFFSADMCCSNTAEDVEDMMRRFAGNPRYAPVYFRYKGGFLLTTFAGSSQGIEFWRALRHDLEHGANPSTRKAPCAQDRCPLAALRGVPSSAPLPIVFVPAFFFGGETPQPAAIAQGLSSFQDVVDGAFYWGIAGVPGLGHPPDQIPSSEAYAAALHAAGKLYMAPVCLHFWGANANRYYEYSGFAGMRSLWMNAIQVTHPEWVEIITWNDFVEGTYISPIADPIFDKAPGVLTPVHSHAGAAELSAYFIRWYKTGRRPVLEHDTLYWAYRPQMVGSALPSSIGTFGPIADRVYVTANLISPATLHVSFGSQTVTRQLPAGSTDVAIPMLPGFVPHFQLLRGSRTLAQADGSDPIRQPSEHPDLYYSTGFIGAPRK